MKFLKYLGGQALLIFVVLTGVFLYFTGSLHFGPVEDDHADEAPAVAADPHAGHGHGSEPHPAEPAPVDPHAGHGHEAEPAPVDPHAGHGHEAEPEPVDPHAGHDHEAEPHDEESEALSCGNPDHDHTGEWCEEHKVLESACTRCNPGLVAEFKARGDWCGEHGLPESQCLACNPGTPLPHEGAKGSFADLLAFKCEHDVRTVDCDACRFEIGVVKVDSGVAKALLERGTVGKRNARRSLRLTGEVQLDRTRVVDVPAPAGGRVLTLSCDLGKKVNENDLLAVIRSGEFADSKAAYLVSLTACEIAEKERERQVEITEALGVLLTSLPRMIEGSPGAEGAHEVTEIPTGLVGEWKSKLVGAASTLRMAKTNHNREHALEEKGISARAEHEQARQEYEAARADYASLVEEVQLSLKLESLKADNAHKQACVSVLAAEQRLRVYGLDDDALKVLKSGAPAADFAQLEIRAPRTGTITSFDISAGRFVAADETLFTIADLDHLWVWCDLYERDLAVVAERLARDKSLPAVLRVTSFPGRTFEGTLDLLGSAIDEHTRTIKARIQVANPGALLRPGMFVDVEIRIPGEGQVRVVPENAVMDDEGDRFVFQYWKDDLWVRRDVSVRHVSDGIAEIEGDIQEGVTVATSGAFMLKGDVLREKMGAG